MEKTRYERITYLSSIGNIYTGRGNSIRGLQYVYGKLDNDDETILKYKDKIKSSIKRMLICSLAVIVEFALLVLFVKLGIGVT